VTPLELATATPPWSTRHPHHSDYIVKVRDRDGKILESVDPADFRRSASGTALVERPRTRAISAETAYLTTSLMESVIQNGTGARAKALGRPAAGKTGTTNELRDAWFVGGCAVAGLTWIVTTRNAASVTWKPAAMPLCRPG